MATQNPLKSSSVRVARAVAAVVFAVILVLRASQTGNWLLAAVGIAVVLVHLALTTAAIRRNRARSGRPEVRAARIPRRFPLSRLGSAEVEGRRLVLRTVDGRTVRLRLTGGPADADLAAQLREAASATGVVIPDPPELAPARLPRAALAIALACVGLGLGVLVADEVGLVTGGQRRPAAIPQTPRVTPQLLAAHGGTFTDPFTRVATCSAYVVPLDVDSTSHANVFVSELAKAGVGGACVTHSLKVSHDALDPARHQLNTHTLMDELRAAYLRARGNTPAHVIGLTEFDLYSPTAPGKAFVTIDEAMYLGQTVAIGSTAHGGRRQDYESLAFALSG